jgi:hypothetical protein
VSWRLKNSRGLFFERTGESPRSYWTHDEIVSLVCSQGGEIPPDLLAWEPAASDSRSNCPLLHRSLVELTQLVDPRWRSRAQNIYAGRVFKADDVAAAEHALRGGMIALSNHYTTAMIAYAAMLYRFLLSVDKGKSEAMSDAAALQRRLRDEFERVVGSFQIVGPLGLKGSWLMRFPSERYRVALDDHCHSAEQWMLAHELAHHLARDMSARKDKGVEEALSRVKARSAAQTRIAALSTPQRQEIDADILATLIVSGYFTDRDSGVLGRFKAIFGAAVTLLTVAHLREEWFTEPEDSHPGCLERLEVLMTIVCEQYGGESAGYDDFYTVSRAAAVLSAFALWLHGGDLQVAEWLDEKHGTAGEDLPHLPRLIAHYSIRFQDYAEAYRQHSAS